MRESSSPFIVPKRSLVAGVIILFAMVGISSYTFSYFQVVALAFGDIAQYIDFFEKVQKSSSTALVIMGSYRYEIGFTALVYAFSGIIDGFTFVNMISIVQLTLFLVFLKSLSFEISKSQLYTWFLILLVFAYFALVHTRFGSSGIRAGLAYSIVIWAFLPKPAIPRHFIFLFAFLIHSSIAIIAILFLFSLTIHQRGYKSIGLAIVLVPSLLGLVLFNATEQILSNLLGVFSVTPQPSFGTLVVSAFFAYLWRDQKFIKERFGRVIFLTWIQLTLLGFVASLVSGNIAADRILDMVKPFYVIFMLLMLHRMRPKVAVSAGVVFVSAAYL